MNKTNTEKNKNATSPQKGGGIQSKYVVPPDFDKTTETLLPLDHYLTNKDVYSIVQTLFSDTRDWSQWAVQHPYDSPCYFSPPYTCRQAILLGYTFDVQNNDNEISENHLTE